MNQILHVGILLLIILGLSTCQEPEESKNNTAIQEVNYGTSFGECLGYCRKSISISPSEITFTKKGWEMEGQLPDSSFRETFNASAWNRLKALIDLDAFKALDPVIGCPDCADGGAEWVEITVNDEPYKVTFEYNDAPAVMAPYIDSLRSYMGRFE